MRNSKKVILPLAGSNAFMEASLPDFEDGTNRGSRMMCFVKPSAEYPLSQIPKGPNPREVDDVSKIYKTVADAYCNDPLFSLGCGGMQAIYSTDTLEFDFFPDGSPYVAFECDEAKLCGHYDGQHNGNAVDHANELEGGSKYNQHYTLALVPNSAFLNLDEVRGVSIATNFRSKQTDASEHNIIGGYDALKNNISYCNVNNIEWCQHQRDQNDEKIPSERKCGQVVILHGAFLPLTFDRATSIQKISAWPKQGVNKSVVYLKDDIIGKYLESSFEHADVVLEMADFIRTTPAKVLGSKLANFGIVKMTTNKQMQKPAFQRRAFKTTLFKDAYEVDHGLNKDMLPMILHAIFKSCYDYNEDTKRFETDMSLAEMKALWLESGHDVLRTIEKRHSASFTTDYKSRYGDFVADDTLWSQLASIVNRAFVTGKWKKHLNTSVKDV
jgi:hypothetical protein